MSPETKFHSLVLGLIVPLMFGVVAYLIPFIQRATWLEVIGGAIAAFFASAGAYKLVAAGLVWLLRQSRWLKSKLLGSYYMEGTWVGYFIGRGGHVRYVIETFEQDLSSLIIRGASYSTDHQRHGQWVSEASFVDAHRGRLIYTYTCDILSRGVALQGVGTFQFERESERAAPYRIEGYVADLVDGRRLPVVEEKISSRVLPFADALLKAKGVVEKMPKLVAEGTEIQQTSTRVALPESERQRLT